MGWLSRTIDSSIGRKTVMAVTGLILALFVVVHLAGLANIFGGRIAFTAYAARLHDLGGLLRLGEIFLLLVFLLHLGFGLLLFLENRRAKPTRYAVNQSAGGRTWGSLSMPYTGFVLLLFLLLHLAHFHFTDSASLSDRLRESLAQPVTGIFYLTALLTLGLHLSHGLWSSLQSLGVSHPKYDRFLEGGGLGISVFITTLFCMIPLLALFWPGFLR
ncbi:MAG TPA: succinate dehydrogenase cytochrome b subunit [Desulfurivibrionaceae bacterium]|nr:succinate dehydrogenase cytochrome b subunit [Desulfurivibrionaceae bacterium]